VNAALYRYVEMARCISLTKCVLCGVVTNRLFWKLYQACYAYLLRF
jgi:hypothetical protein